MKNSIDFFLLLVPFDTSFLGSLFALIFYLVGSFLLMNSQ